MKKRAFIFLIIFTVCYNNLVFAIDNADVKKEETVYVLLESSGHLKKTIVNCRISGDIIDRSIIDKVTLEDVKYLFDNRSKSIKNDQYIWEENSPSIVYQGISKSSPPIELKIDYYLNGKKMDCEKIAGKTGKLEIKIEAINKDLHSVKVNGEKREIYTPFLLAGTINLPSDKFKNISVLKGDIISDGKNQLVFFSTFPNLAKSLGIKSDDFTITISADVNSFSMGSMVFGVEPVFHKLDSFIGAKSVVEIESSVEDLKGAMQTLYDGGIELKNGNEEIFEGIYKIDDGIDKLSLGALGLDSGLNSLVDGSNSVYKGVITLDSYIEEISDGAKTFGEKSIEFSNISKDYIKDANCIANGVKIALSEAKTLNKSLIEVDSNIKKLKEYNEENLYSITLSNSMINSMQKKTARKEFLVNIIDKSFEAFEKSAECFKIESLKIIAQNKKEYIKKLKEEVQYEYTYIDILKNYNKKMMQQNEEMALIIKNLENTTKDINNKYEKMSKMCDIISRPAFNMIADGMYINLLSKGLQDGAKKLTNGADEIRLGMEPLKIGSKDLDDGIKELKSGSGRLLSGIDELKSGSGDLCRGVDELSSGLEAFSNGLCDFNKSGIESVSNFTILKDKLMELSKSYNTFSGLSSDMNGSVRFIMKTEPIEYEKSVATYSEAKTKKDEGFFRWLIKKWLNI